MSLFQRGRCTALSFVFTGMLTIAGCSTASTHPGADRNAADVVFPDPAKSTRPEGAFVNLENLRKVQPGMTKDQLYDLLGTPHFNEGVVGVKKWNYIFDFRKVGGAADDFSRCQYQVVFDKDHRAQAVYWKPEDCKSELDMPAQAVAANVPEPRPLPQEPIRLSGDALFAFNRSDLTEVGRQDLAQFLRMIQQASQVENVSIVGYSDRIGNDQYNLALSRRRAESVQRYLAAGGVPEAAMRSEGRGNADAVVQCTDINREALIKCLAPNRRVEISGIARR
ncbi:outer membrane protein assembly factor BamE domain-containing protein [Rhodanobacter sp. BL-MT-08]